ncbi:MAG: DNA-binding response regulator [Leptolyngbya sp. PLA3]|nr:MAG: DNA-binding response regulator [Cyanobacteria bacterium CYA]MCE7969830.1 DNA-binding response regulator [Leptolyngbya sp. PL-A3]
MHTSSCVTDIIRGLQESSSCTALWETLLGMPGVGIALIRCDGILLFASNEFKLHFFGDAQIHTRGRSLLDLFPREWAKERIEFLGRIESEQERITVREIWRGRQLLTRVGLLPWREEGRPIACVVTRPANAGEVEGLEQVVNSSFVELGDLSVLTPRELAVLALLGEGLTLKQIAERLHRSFKTIDNHRASIGRKLRESDRVALSRLALEAGLTLADASLKRVNYSGN